MDINKLFLYSLDNIRTMFPSDQWKKKSSTPVIPRLNRRKRNDVEWSKVITQKVQKVSEDLSISKPQEGKTK